MCRIIWRSRVIRNVRFREGNVFRRMFERVVEVCIAAGGEGFAVGPGRCQQAALDCGAGLARRDRDPSSRPVKEYLATLGDTA